MKKSWILTVIVLSFAIIGIILFYNKNLNIDELSAFGSIFAAAGSFIAVIWFYNSLQQQNIQLNEQRKQFQLEFNNLRLEIKRNQNFRKGRCSKNCIRNENHVRVMVA